MKDKKKEDIKEETEIKAETPTEEPEESGEKDLEKENEELKAALEKATKEAAENKADYLRARADCENVRKRKAEEVRAAYDDGRTEVFSKILGIGDSLDWALKMPLEEKTREGIEKLLKKYHEILESSGVKEFSPEEGSAFDPNSAQAVMTVGKEDGETAGTVKQVFGRGYKLGEKVIRYAQVSVVGDK